MNPNLEHWLAIHYRARVLKVGKIDDTVRMIRERLEADQSLLKAAREEKSRIEELMALCGGPSQLARRCFVSSIHLEALSAVIPT